MGQQISLQLFNFVNTTFLNKHAHDEVPPAKSVINNVIAAQHNKMKMANELVGSEN